MEMPIIDASADYTIDPIDIRITALQLAIKVTDTDDRHSPVQEVLIAAKHFEHYITDGTWEASVAVKKMMAESAARDEAAED